jgi:hypothetical protein
MVIETIARAILSNLELVLIAIVIGVTVLKLRKAKMHRTVMTPSYTLWGELLFYGIGFGFLWAGIFHAFFQHLAAAAIGWQPSPFEWELAFAEFGVAVIALMSLGRGYEMRLAATIVFFIFSAGAAIQHINQMLCCHNYAPGNAGTILWINDIALPLVLLYLAFASRDAYERTARVH